MSKNYICKNCGEIIENENNALFHIDGNNKAITKNSKPICRKCANGNKVFLKKKNNDFDIDKILESINFYECHNCNYKMIMDIFNYCPSCGSKIIWEEKKDA